MWAFMSFMFFYVVSQHASARALHVCVRRVRCLIRGKIPCYFQTALFKRLLWCTKSDLKCACSLPLIFSKKPSGEACPLGCCHFTFSTAELFKDSNAQTTQSQGNNKAAVRSGSTSKTDLFVRFLEGHFVVSLDGMALNIHCG